MKSGPPTNSPGMSSGNASCSTSELSSSPPFKRWNFYNRTKSYVILITAELRNTSCSLVPSPPRYDRVWNQNSAVRSFKCLLILRDVGSDQEERLKKDVRPNVFTLWAAKGAEAEAVCVCVCVCVSVCVCVWVCVCVFTQQVGVSESVHRILLLLLWLRLLQLQEGPPQLLIRDDHALSDITQVTHH